MILIRRFAPTDISSVLRIVEQSLGESYPPSLYLTIHNIWSDGFLLLLDDGRIAGFVAAIPSGSKVARVLMLAVLPEHRNKSYGKALMKELYQNSLSRGIDTVILEVRKSNSTAVSFYKDQGFSICGEIREFYSNGEDAYKMIKTLRT